MSYEEMLNYCTTMAKDESTSAKAVIKVGINRGLRRLRKKLKRLFAIETRTFSYTQNQATYQVPEDCIRPDRIVYIDGGTRDPLTYVDDDNEWDNMKLSVNQTGRPYLWRMISKDVFEVYPQPTSTTATGEIRMQIRAKPLSQLDYTTGSVTVTQGSQTVTGSGTTFAASMIGRSFRLADGNGHLEWYRISDVPNATTLTLENMFAGVSGNTLSYRIGEIANIPSDFHDSLTDHGLYNYYNWRKDPEQAKTYYSDFLAVEQTIEEDDSPTTSNVIESKRARDADMARPFYEPVPKAITS